MTISSETRKAGPFDCNGTTTQFPFSFKVFGSSDLLVVLTDTNSIEGNLSLGTDYTVSLNQDQDSTPGGTVNTVSTYPAGFLLTLTSKVENLQPVRMTNQGGIYPQTINDALDRATILIQQLKVDVDRAFKVGFSSSSTPDEMIDQILESVSISTEAASSASASANQAAASAEAAALFDPSLKQNADDTLTALAAVTTAANKLIYATGADTFSTTDLSAFARTLLDDADAADVKATLGISAQTSMVRLQTGNGAGSTNTAVYRYTTVLTNAGSDITYADSASLGATFTINTSGMYAISMMHTYGDGSGTAYFCTTVNDTELTIYNANNMTNKNRVLAFTSQPVAVAPCVISWSGYLSVGDVIRAKTAHVVASALQQFTIARMG